MVLIRVTIMADAPAAGDEGMTLSFPTRKELDVAVATAKTSDRALTAHEVSLLQAVAKSLPEVIEGLVEVIASKGMFQLAWKRLPGG
jgi:hypothetical protein